ncbi:MAG: glycosyltransferase family 2 protein [Deltaproteobacteria bacterium]|nr:glycosyltransferase family 2 protein [Deltaproteobacteria bacterium]
MNTTNPAVSIIIPTHNRKFLLQRALNSVLKQTFTDYEIIVVDDASTDGTDELLASHFYGNVTVIKKSSSEGPGAARNTGILASQGDYIAFLDDDDKWLPKKLQLQMQLMKQHPSVGMVYCGFLQMDENGAELRQVLPEKRGAVFQDLLIRNHITGSDSAVLIRKSLLDEIGLFDNNFYTCEDWDLWIRAARRSHIDFIAEPLVKLYIHGSNLHKNLPRMERDSFALLDKYAVDISEKNKSSFFFDRCVYWAWMYWNAGCRADFSRLLLQAIELFPLSDKIISYDGDLRDKEEAFFDIFKSYWEQPGKTRTPALIKKAFNRHYILLAWAYYQRGEMRHFRRCIRHALACSSPSLPLSLLIFYLLSFSGKPFLNKLLVIKEQTASKIRRQERSSAHEKL